MAPKAFVDPDSVLARTAQQMLAAHAGGAGPSEGMTECPVCGEPLPCPAGRSAAEVVEAAGLAEASGLIAVHRQGLGGPSAFEHDLPYASPLAFGSPLEISPSSPAHEEPWSGPSAGAPLTGGGPVEVSFSPAGFPASPDHSSSATSPGLSTSAAAPAAGGFSSTGAFSAGHDAVSAGADAPS